MHYNPAGKAKLFAAFTALAAWFALALQYYLNIKNAASNGLTALESTSRFFSYFTILTVLLVAICLTVLLIIPGSLRRFFSLVSVQTGIAVYIFVVGLGYNILLRHIWSPLGWQKVADESLHVVVPILYVLYWAIFVPAGNLPWKNLITWLYFPFFYAVFCLVRGPLDGFYPYYFVDAKQLGYAIIARNIVALFVALVVFSYLFIVIGRWKSKFHKN